MMTDPWLSTADCGTRISQFEDNFEPDYRLPDSVEYLATLEKKLAKLRDKTSKRDLVKSFEDTHKSCMIRLITDGTSADSTEDHILDTPVSPQNSVARRIAPERQALTYGEIVELLKADQLSKSLSEDLTSIERDCNTKTSD